MVRDDDLAIDAAGFASAIADAVRPRNFDDGQAGHKFTHSRAVLESEKPAAFKSFDALAETRQIKLAPAGVSRATRVEIRRVEKEKGLGAVVSLEHLFPGAVLYGCAIKPAVERLDGEEPLAARRQRLGAGDGESAAHAAERQPVFDEPTRRPLDFGEPLLAKVVLELLT
jgi:hypothetical protein